jgi:hypothetical protein
MSWTVEDYAHSNHSPIAIVNNDATIAPIRLDATVGRPITLDASASHDPDAHQTLTYHWIHYQEAGLADGALADLTLTNADSPILTVTPKATCRPAWIPAYMPCPAVGTAHIILAVTDSGTPQLTTYRRIILTVRKPAN